MTSWVAKVGVTFKSVDWFVPPYMKGGAIRKLAVEIDSAPTDRKHTALEMGLRSLYSPRYLAAMFLGTGDPADSGTLPRRRRQAGEARSQITFRRIVIDGRYVFETTPPSEIRRQSATL